MRDRIPTTMSEANPVESPKKVTAASRKEEIFAAYQELLAQKGLSASLSSEKAAEPPTAFDQVERNLADLKMMLDVALAEIAREKKWREEIAEEWEKQRRQVEEERREQKARLDHEEEEYRYQLQLQRQKEENEFEEKKNEARKKFATEVAEKEAVLAKREEAIKLAEKELTELRQQAEAFPSQLETAVGKAASEAKSAAEKEAAINHQLFAQKAQSEKELLEQKIASLQETVKLQVEEVTSLKRVADEATKQLKDVAVKVIQGPSPFSKPQTEISHTQ